jgi:hypothetical protein
MMCTIRLTWAPAGQPASQGWAGLKAPAARVVHPSPPINSNSMADQKPTGTRTHDAPTVSLPDGNAAGVATGDAPVLGAAPFTLTARIHTDASLGSELGDIVSQFDAESRTGFSFGLQTQAVVAAQANHRNLHFSLDSGSSGSWTDCGRPGTAIQVVSLVTHEGSLFTGTYENPGSGRVYRYVSGTTWEDLGAPDPCNSVQAMASFNGDLYVGVGCYRASGSALELSENMAPGGTIYKWLGGEAWESTGTLPALRDPKFDNPHAGIQDYGSPGSPLEHWSADRIDTVCGAANAFFEPPTCTKTGSGQI